MSPSVQAMNIAIDHVLWAQAQGHTSLEIILSVLPSYGEHLPLKYELCRFEHAVWLIARAWMDTQVSPMRSAA